MLIIWHDSHASGIQIIDEQRRGLVSIINSLHFSLVFRHKTVKLCSFFDLVLAYTKIQFNTERGLMEISGYPRLKEHNLQHEHFIEEVKHLSAICTQEGREPEIFLDFMKQWWKEHILKSDMDCSVYVLEYLRSYHRVIKKR